MTKQQKIDLETLIDKNTLADVMDTLADICLEKANHIRDKDNQTAKVWENASKKISQAWVTIFNLKI